jgi:hypothetical protein
MKTEVYSWRLSPHLKSQLQEAARVEQKTVSDLLEEIVKSRLQQAHGGSGAEEEHQRRMREAGLKCAGSIEGPPGLAESARPEVRARIARRHGA